MQYRVYFEFLDLKKKILVECNSREEAETLARALIKIRRIELIEAEPAKDFGLDDLLQMFGMKK